MKWTILKDSPGQAAVVNKEVDPTWQIDERYSEQSLACGRNFALIKFCAPPFQHLQFNLFSAGNFHVDI